MATITNRSRYFVRSASDDTRYAEFPFHRLEAAKSYYAELTSQKLRPELGQLEDTFEVRIRQKGYPDQNHTCGSLEEAETVVARIEAERKSGLFIDYTKAHQITFVDLIKRYAAEEGPKHKGWEKVEKYKCQGWLEDVEGTLAKRVAQRDAEIAGGGVATVARGAMRQPANGLQWMKKPFAQVETKDIENYICDRLEVVAKSTVDREVDVLSSICAVATKVWKIRVVENPMTGVRRPRYFNERDRRLKTGEEARLFAAARDEDVRRSIDLRTEELMTDARAIAVGLETVYQRKNHVKAALAACGARAQHDHRHIPLYEAFVSFQIMTAARRGETLGLVWSNVDLAERTAYLPETKNGRPRKLALRADLVAILERLPRNDERVFPLSEDALKDAWKRITQSAGLDDLHIHDLRHEGISRVAETGMFSLVDLQAFSGHKDTRMLLRYAHLCTKQLAERLDQAFGESARETDLTTLHHGRRRISKAAGVTLAAIVDDHGAEAAASESHPIANVGDIEGQSNVIPFKRAS
jgi:integrase